MNSNFVTTSDGCQLQFYTWGKGKPLLLIPGLGGQAAFWTQVIDHLDKDTMVLSFDHRGCGKSDRPEHGYSIERIALDAIEVMDAAGVERADVVGHSTGGMIAQHLALDYGDRVNRLILSGTWYEPDERYQAFVNSRIHVLREAGPETYQRLTHALGYPSDYLDENKAQLEAVVNAAPVTLAPIPVTQARLEMLLRGGRAADLHKISHDTLVVSALDDGMIPPYHAEKLAEAIPTARHARCDGSHFYPKSRPREFTYLVRTFLN